MEGVASFGEYDLGTEKVFKDLSHSALDVRLKSGKSKVEPGRKIPTEVEREVPWLCYE